MADRPLIHCIDSLRFFSENAFFGHKLFLEIFRLGMGQISSSPVYSRKTFVTLQQAVLSTSVAFYAIFAWGARNLRVRSIQPELPEISV